MWYSMKNKKRVLTILLSLIAVVAVVLLVVLILGGSVDSRINKFKSEVEGKTCEYAQKENVNKRICEYFSDLCKVKFKTLINYKYLDENMENPLKKTTISKDTDSYVQITWEEGTPHCSYKEGK